MKTSPFPLWRVALAALSTASLFATPALAASAATVPVGYMTFNLVGGGNNNPIGVPLIAAEAFSGSVNSVAATVITVAGNPWTDGQFAAANAPFFVTILSGDQAGRSLKIIANTTNSVTIELQSGEADLTSNTGFAVLGGTSGDRFAIAPADTLATFFGNNTTQPLILTGATSAVFADTVQIHNGVNFASYFFNTTQGINRWVMFNGGNVDQSNLVLYPDRAIMILRRGGNLSFTVEGRVPSTKRLTRLEGGGTTSAISVRFPTDTTLGALNFEGPGSWMTNASIVFADTVGLWNGTKWTFYWQISPGGQWQQQNGGTTDHSNDPIPAGSGLLIIKRGAATGATAFFSQPLPYALD